MSDENPFGIGDTVIVLPRQEWSNRFDVGDKLTVTRLHSYFGVYLDDTGPESYCWASVERFQLVSKAKALTISDGLWYVKTDYYPYFTIVSVIAEQLNPATLGEKLVFRFDEEGSTEVEAIGIDRFIGRVPPPNV